MRLLARIVYLALVWKERRLARRIRQHGLDGRRSSSESQEEREATHLDTGRRGEALAYWYLRQAGYTVVARNRRPGIHSEHQPGPVPGELDLVAWDGLVLVFVEVKTRTSDSGLPPEMAVSTKQRQRILSAARTYLRRTRALDVSYRFDVASVTWNSEAGYQVRLVKGAFK